MTPTSIVAYVALFAIVGFGFLFVALLLGRFLRAAIPTAEKLETYECGEPPVGSASVQFDLRFYVVALVFIIFEVEVAFFFPWATVFGKAAELAGMASPSRTAGVDWQEAESEPAKQWRRAVRRKYGEMGTRAPQLPAHLFSRQENLERIGAVEANARSLARASMADISVFFAVLLVGFAYVWKRGDLNWVRALGHPSAMAEERAERSAPGPDSQ